jgi:hypothetical protein
MTFSDYEIALLRESDEQAPTPMGGRSYRKLDQPSNTYQAFVDHLLLMKPIDYQQIAYIANLRSVKLEKVKK